jgi:hypothetical protein
MERPSSTRPTLSGVWSAYWQQTSPEEAEGLAGLLGANEPMADVFWAGFSPLARVFVWFELRYGMESQLLPEARLAQQLLACGSAAERHRLAHEFTEQRKRTCPVRALLGLLQSPQRLVEAVR